MVAAAIVLMIVLSIVGLLVLGYFIARETSETTVTDRQSAIGQVHGHPDRSSAPTRRSEQEGDTDRRDEPT